MSDLIKLLPGHVANQIAAGEVIQRPASAVKELLENAIDAKADEISLIVKDAGKTLIQITDNGSGMSARDAALCFERHATSKISKADDLYAISTMGFRGEALASIAAIARVELKTRLHEEDLGTEIIIEGSEIKQQQACQCAPGTSISVKNLFFNTPARRNFLKSDMVEKGHILNEFTRIALSRPDIAFSYYQNGQLTHQLQPGNLKKRITGLFGNAYNQRLVPVEEKTDMISLSGFISKPEYARKKRGEQFFFVNNRFVKSAYLAHAVDLACQELIPGDSFPSFFLQIGIDAAQIDVNIHPTKAEIKFQDERYVYQIIKASVRRSLGKFNISPTLDFERETAFDNLISKDKTSIRPPSVSFNPEYNPFSSQGGISSGQPSQSQRLDPEKWEQLFTDKLSVADNAATGQQTVLSPDWETSDKPTTAQKAISIHGRYILAPVKSGLMLIDQRRALERIFYERMLMEPASGESLSQQLLFPETIRLQDQEADMLSELIPEMEQMGFSVVGRGMGSFVINAVPADLAECASLQEVIEAMLDVYESQQDDDRKTRLAKSLAVKLAAGHTQKLNDPTIVSLAESLFACRVPEYSPLGKPVLLILSLEDIAGLLK